MSQANTNKCQIRTYVRLFPCLGIDQILDNQYQILDGHTFFSKNRKRKIKPNHYQAQNIDNNDTNMNMNMNMNKIKHAKKDRKQNNFNYTIHTFNYIFNHQFQNAKQIQHINVIDDCLQGKDQLIFVDVAREFMHGFLIGTADDPGFLISLFTSLFNQTYIASSSSTSLPKPPSKSYPHSQRHPYSNSQFTHNHGHSYSNSEIYSQNHQKGHGHSVGVVLSRPQNQSITISAFSTQQNSNKFLDLILCQKFTFYSKKDIDEHKDFYSKQIRELRQFLILLKIVILHYKECCKQADPIVFRIVVNNYDELHAKRYKSTLLLVACQIGSKVQADFIRKVQFGLRCGGAVKGEDHGSLVNYLQRYILKSKFVFLYGIPFRKSVMDKSTPIFEFLNQLKSKYFQFEPSRTQMDISEKAVMLNNFVLPKCRLGSRNLNHKQISQAAILLDKLSQFLIQTQSKWRSYCQIFKQIIQIQDEFYNRQQFPISLQIQEYNIKSFLISKIYRLSQTFRMDDLTNQMQKIRTIKNQVILAFKALNNNKQLVHFRSNPHSEEFLKFYDMCLHLIYSSLKCMFGISYRCVQVSGLDIGQVIKVERVLDNSEVKGLAQKLRDQAKQIKERQQISLRNLNMSIEDCSPEDKIQATQRYSFSKQPLTGTKTFELFKKNRRSKQMSDLGEFTNRMMPVTSVGQVNKTKIKQQQTQQGLQNSVQLPNNSTLLTKPANQSGKNQHENKIKGSNGYSLSLPKIAIIHHKKHLR